MSTSLTALRQSETALIRSIHATADALDRLATSDLQTALERLEASKTALQERMSAAMASLYGAAAEVALEMDDFASGIVVELRQLDLFESLPAPEDVCDLGREFPEAAQGGSTPDVVPAPEGRNLYRDIASAILGKQTTPPTEARIDDRGVVHVPDDAPNYEDRMNLIGNAFASANGVVREGESPTPPEPTRNGKPRTRRRK